MEPFNNCQEESVIPGINDSGLTAEAKRKSAKSNSKQVLSKGDSRYWLAKDRLFKNHGAADYSCRFSTLNRREHFALGTQNKKSAAAKAAEIFNFIRSHGWDEAILRYKPRSPAKVESLTVGEFVRIASEMSSARSQSLEGYAKALRLIVSEIKSVSGEGKFDAYGGGTAIWKAKVDEILLETVSPAEILGWKNNRLREAEGDPLAKRRAIITVNSLMRNAKSLFGKKVLPFIEQVVTLPRPLPFDGVPFEKEPSLRYVSRMNPHALLAKAKDELAESDPESFKVMVLALVIGLRRAEMDYLLWRAFDFNQPALLVESSEYHELKSDDSTGKIDLDHETAALFRKYRAAAPEDIFVIKGPTPPQPTSQARSRGNKSGKKAGSKTGQYRCNAVFARVISWLRENGVDGHKPIHTLRKEIGSIIASEHGIFEASRYLRHADIHITSAFYADKKKAVTPQAFAGLLGIPNPEEKIH